MRVCVSVERRSPQLGAKASVYERDYKKMVRRSRNNTTARGVVWFSCGYCFAGNHDEWSTVGGEHCTYTWTTARDRPRVKYRSAGDVIYPNNGDGYGGQSGVSIVVTRGVGRFRERGEGVEQGRGPGRGEAWQRCVVLRSTVFILYAAASAAGSLRIQLRPPRGVLAGFCPRAPGL